MTHSKQTDTFKLAAPKKVDVVFVIDNSGSMANEQKGVRDGFRSFTERARLEGIDYQIGDTTTDTTPGKKPGCLIGAPDGIVSGSTFKPEQAFAAILDKVGIAGSSAEMGLEAAYLALSPPANTHAYCTKGLVRPDATLSLIFVSDEMDSSPKTVQFYLTFFKSIKFGNLLCGVLAVGSILTPGPPLPYRPSATGEGGLGQQGRAEIGRPGVPVRSGFGSPFPISGAAAATGEGARG